MQVHCQWPARCSIPDAAEEWLPSWHFCSPLSLKVRCRCLTKFRTFILVYVFGQNCHQSLSNVSHSVTLLSFVDTCHLEYGVSSRLSRFASLLLYHCPPTHIFKSSALHSPVMIRKKSTSESSPAPTQPRVLLRPPGIPEGWTSWVHGHFQVVTKAGTRTDDCPRKATICRLSTSDRGI